MSAKSHLALFDVTLKEANDFIQSHVVEPQVIFNAASLLGIPTSMLSEITGYSTDVINEYFAAAGLDTSVLDIGSLAGKRKIISSEAAVLLENYFTLNNNIGVLSTSALREKISADTNADDYFTFFDPENFKGSDDGIFTSEELGIDHLSDLPATTETLESLFYGTFINFFRAMDFDEALRFNNFLEANPDAFDDDFYSPEAIALLFDIFSDPAADPFFSNSQILLLTEEAVTTGISLIGIETGSRFFEVALTF